MGTRVIPDLKACLNRLARGGFTVIPFEGKEYIGAYLPLARPTIQDMRIHFHRLIDVLQKNLPDLRANTLPIGRFPSSVPWLEG